MLLEQSFQLFRLEAAVGQDLSQQPHAQRAGAQGNDRCATVRMPHEVVASSCAFGNEACAFQCPYELFSGWPGQRAHAAYLCKDGHSLDADELEVAGLLALRLKAKFDRFANVRHELVNRRSIGVAPG